MLCVREVELLCLAECTTDGFFRYRLMTDRQCFRYFLFVRWHQLFVNSFLLLWEYLSVGVVCTVWPIHFSPLITFLNVLLLLAARQICLPVASYFLIGILITFAYVGDIIKRELLRFPYRSRCGLIADASAHLNLGDYRIRYE